MKELVDRKGMNWKKNIGLNQKNTKMGEFLFIYFKEYYEITLCFVKYIWVIILFCEINLLQFQ